MKKTTVLAGLTFAFCSLSLLSKVSAQITIDQTDMPYTGLTVVTDSDGTSKPSPGTLGGPQFWDFSTLQRQAAKTILFMAPSSTPYASTFTTANLADSTIGGNGYTFINSSSSAFNATGAEEIEIAAANSFQIEINLAPDFLQSNLPATLGNVVPPTLSTGMEQFNITFSVVVTGERFYDSISYNDTVDAWGTMKMPNGYTYDVLRQKHNETDYENVFIDIFSSWSSYERFVVYKNQYDWYAKGIGYILTEMDMDSTTSNVKDIIWDTTAPAPVTTSVNRISNQNVTIVYPNPCTTSAKFLTSAKNASTVSIFDISGRMIDRVSMKNGIATYNTSAFSNGMYLYEINDLSGNVIDRGKFSVQK